MDMNESGEKGMEVNASSGAAGIPVEWQTQFSAAASRARRHRRSSSRFP